MSEIKGVPIVCIAGPTASGKTALSISLAKAVDAEIISVDSALVYRGLNIGAAKPSAEEQAGIAHHLMDVVNPDEAFSVGQFVAQAHEAIFDIASRGKVPILVGGTMLYFKALLQGMDELPKTSIAVRAQVQADLEAHGVERLYRQLQEVDQPLAQRLKPRDTQRIARGLEVFLSTGKRLSDLQTGNSGSEFEQVLFWGLLPADRAWLHQRIEKRFDQMLAEGFEEEVQGLINRYDFSINTPSMRSVGYRQMWAWIKGELPDVESMRDRGIIATRQLAKKQLTWLRSWPDLHPLDPMELEAETMLIMKTREWLGHVN